MSDPIGLGFRQAKPSVEARMQRRDALRAQAERRRKDLRNVELVAKKLIRDLDMKTKPMLEPEFIAKVQDESGYERPLVAYIVDELRTEGSLTKNWSTGTLQAQID